MSNQFFVEFPVDQKLTQERLLDLVLTWVSGIESSSLYPHLVKGDLSFDEARSC